jgi:hypothetical protein
LVLVLGANYCSNLHPLGAFSDPFSGGTEISMRSSTSTPSRDSAEPEIVLGTRVGVTGEMMVRI